MVYVGAAELMARVLKSAHGKISLARGIQYCPNFFEFLLPYQCIYIVKNKCIYVYAHISDCVEAVYELPLLPNDTASETFLHKLGAVRSGDWIFITGAAAWR